MAESRKNRGFVLAIVMTAAGALVAGCAGDPEYEPVANIQTSRPADGVEKVVTCTMSPMFKVDPPVTANELKAFKVTLLAGTAACLDERGAEDRIIGITYGEQKLARTSGTCADFKIAMPTVKVTWIFAGGKVPREGQISTDEFEFSGRVPPSERTVATVTGGPLAGSKVNVVSDPMHVAYLLNEDCRTSGVSMLAGTAVIKFTLTA